MQKFKRKPRPNFCRTNSMPAWAKLVERAWMLCAAKPSGQRGTSCPSSGSRTPPPRECWHRTAGASTSWCTAPPHRTSRCAALAMVVGDKGCATWLLTSGAGGAGMRMSSFVSSSVSTRSGRPHPPLGARASAAWARRWWGMLSVAVQHAIGGTAQLLSGANRPQPPANALSMVLSTARRSGQGASWWKNIMQRVPFCIGCMRPRVMQRLCRGDAEVLCLWVKTIIFLLSVFFGVWAFRMWHGRFFFFFFVSSLFCLGGGAGPAQRAKQKHAPAQTAKK